ncbi:MAG: Ig-like domain-containing protein [Verrucomicrobiales bacterium]
MKTYSSLIAGCVLSVSLMVADTSVVAEGLRLVEPTDGQQFQPGETIRLRAIVENDTGGAWQVEIYDGSRRIGETIPNGTIFWRDARGGDHVLSARAIDANGTTLTSAAVNILVGPGPALPVVRLFSSGWSTTEPCPTCRVIPASLSVERTEPTAEALTVFLQVDGTATAGEDYQVLPALLEIPAGEKSVQVTVGAHDDALVEGPEVVRVRLAEPMTDLGSPTYLISSYADEVMLVIFDDEPDAPEARLDIIEPNGGQHVPLGSTIQLSAMGVYTRNEILRPVEFYDGATFLGQSTPQALGRPSIPGLPSVHTITWTNPSAGRRVLTARTELSLDLWVSSPPIEIWVGDEPPATVVSIEATRHIAEEDSAPFDRLPLTGEFTISRAGPTNESLPVFVHYSGSATEEEDYSAPWLVTIPAGAASTIIRIEPGQDNVREGIETVVATVSNCPPDGLRIPCYAFEIDSARARATVFIRDDGTTRASVEIASPEDGAAFEAGDPILIRAVAIDLDGYIGSVEFWAGDQRIGASTVNFIRAPDPGTPIEHEFEWLDAPSGAHLITARAVSSSGINIRSNPVNIRVGGEPPAIVVRIEATANIAEESSMPLRRLKLAGVFTISRTGPTSGFLPVSLKYSGMAAPNEDYPALPGLVSIPAGSTSIELRVEANPDQVAEGIETLVATVSNDPPPQVATIDLSYDGFDVDPAAESATIFIRDDGITEASLRITRPAAGAAFNAGDAIPIGATAIDLNGFISRVEFWDGEQRIGVSDIIFIQPPPAGTPIDHSFEWLGAAVGPHVLSARGIATDGAILMSTPVHITVGAPNQPPAAALASPVAGEEFPPETNIEMVAAVSDPDGYVRKVEFFADGRKIGEVGLEFVQSPPPGQSQTFSFVWHYSTPGPHVLTIRATDNGGRTVESASVEIRVTEPETLPVVIVVASDPFAVEPAPNAVLNTATFRIRRFGSTAGDLVVSYSLRGTALNGVDYEILSGEATIVAGETSVLVGLRPLHDDVVEGIESVVLLLQHPTDPLALQLPAYRIGFRSQAVALIGDVWEPPIASADCVRVGDSLLHICFAGENGTNYRIEVSGDLKNWETMTAGIAVDGMLHFVDDEMAGRRQRYYRVAPEAVIEAEP